MPSAPPAQTLYSAVDASVNVVTPAPDGGLWEARYVRRVPQYFIAYVSSHTGCRMACRFCHLTATGQTMETPATLDRYLGQVDAVLAHYDAVAGTQGAAGRMNVNFMARGEPLANPLVLDELGALTAPVAARAAARGLAVKFNVSSILPRTLGDRSLATVLADERAMLYYSLYSMRDAFRRRWLPRALPAAEGLDRVAEYQRATGRLVTLHWAFIAGENDDEGTVTEIAEAVTARGLRAKFNLVRYNPFSPAQGAEPEVGVLERNFAILRSALGHAGSRIVPRVGYDVQASCGMFVAGSGARRAAPSGPPPAAVA